MTSMKNGLSKALLGQIQESNNFFQKAEKFAKFFIESHHVGYLNGDILGELQKRSLVEVKENGVQLKEMKKDERSRLFAGLLEELRQENKYRTLQGWRDELYDVWVDGRKKSLMTYERSAAKLFGFTTYGVHVNGYLNHPEKGWCMWVGKRSATKQTYPNKLDQVVAGGLTSGLGILECTSKECKEEASFTPDLISKLKPTGMITCFYEDERGVCPECQYIFDVELPEDYQPRCQDGEMESFTLLTYPEVLEKIASGEFKLNCGIICLDFFIRHGYITPDTEPFYNEMVAGLHVEVP